MSRKTEGLNQLVSEVLSRFEEPFSEDIIRQVCFAIEADNSFSTQYRLLVDELGRGVANQAIGRYVKEQTGLESLNQVKVEPGHIIQSYTRLG